MNVGHLVYRTDSLTYTVAKAVSFGGHDVFIWVVDGGQDHAHAEGIQKCIRDTPRVTVVAGDESRLPKVIDRLIVQVFPRPAESIRDVAPIARRALRISVITAGDRSRSLENALKLQWLETRRLARHASKIDRFLYKDGYHRRDLYGWFARRCNLGFDVHSQFLHDERLFQAVHARDWSPDERRPILANFLGCRDPADREEVLASVRGYFRSSSGDAPTLPTAKSMYWHEYPDSAPIGIEPREFLSVLTRSDFTLCPRGYSLVTHRPMEALLRGSIPVVDVSELDLYGVTLEDGSNCIGVPAGEWPTVLRKLAATPESEIVRMRMRIYRMFESELRYDAVASGIRMRLGIEA